MYIREIDLEGSAVHQAEGNIFPQIVEEACLPEIRTLHAQGSGRGHGIGAVQVSVRVKIFGKNLVRSQCAHSSQVMSMIRVNIFGAQAEETLDTVLVVPDMLAENESHGAFQSHA